VPIYYCIEDAEQWQVVIDLGDRAAVQVARLETTEPHFGGVRWWFSCPQCGKRCKKLYLPPGQWEIGCRLCHNLTYRSAQTAHTMSGDQQVQSVRKCCASLITRVYGKDVATDLIDQLRRMR
jgi:hypothetical protein